MADPCVVLHRKPDSSSWSREHTQTEQLSLGRPRTRRPWAGLCNQRDQMEREAKAGYQTACLREWSITLVKGERGSARCLETWRGGGARWFWGLRVGDGEAETTDGQVRRVAERIVRSSISTTGRVEVVGLLACSMLLMDRSETYWCRATTVEAT